MSGARTERPTAEALVQRGRWFRRYVGRERGTLSTMLWRSAASLSLALAAVFGIVAFVASSHAVLNKRDTRSAMGWVGLIVLVPGLGALLYLLLGINRIQRRARRLRSATPEIVSDVPAARVSSTAGAAAPAPVSEHLRALARLAEHVTSRPLVPGNRIEMLRDGDETYPAMIGAIDGATRSIAFATYIFDVDDAGRPFIEAFARAHARGVDVRVLVDDAGARYSRPRADRLLRARGVPTATFLPVYLPWALPYSNLRNHRKVMVVDGRVGFTGGMNIREGCLHRSSRRSATRDVHFRVRGPVLAHLFDVFAEDWYFASGERLGGEPWTIRGDTAGTALARGIIDGPDDDLDVLRSCLLGAIATARTSIRIVTPYFLPDEALVTALNVAALRGVRVDIVVPEKGNLALVSWAMRGELWKSLGRGCSVWLTPRPFDHAKVLVVDGEWSLVGSANWDPRSLRLNFEFDVECYDRELARQLDAFVDERVASARALDARELTTAPLPTRLRDGFARLFVPFL
jgi:cardiolipin synthase A/B